MSRKNIPGQGFRTGKSKYSSWKKSQLSSTSSSIRRSLGSRDVTTSTQKGIFSAHPTFVGGQPRSGRPGSDKPKVKRPRVGPESAGIIPEVSVK